MFRAYFSEQILVLVSRASGVEVQNFVANTYLVCFVSGDLVLRTSQKLDKIRAYIPPGWVYTEQYKVQWSIILLSQIVRTKAGHETRLPREENKDPSHLPTAENGRLFREPDRASRGPLVPTLNTKFYPVKQTR